MTFCGGVHAAETAFNARKITPTIGRNSVQAPTVTAADFRTTSNRAETDVIGVIPGKIITEHLHEVIEPQNGDKSPDIARDLIKIAVVERHGINGNIATGFVKGFGLQRGAIASTVCHDHHNIACVGANYDDMALASNRMTALEGGFVVTENGKILAELALPVAGLMSLESFEHVREKLEILRAAAKSLGVTLDEPFLQLAFLALPVIPMLKITDRGMVDVAKFEIISS
jgi:adenine deaminase